MKSAWLAGLLLNFAGSVSAQVAPPLNLEELQKCLPADEARKMVQDASKGFMERAKPVIAAREREMQLALQRIEQAEARYKHCMKIEDADLASQSTEKPLPCSSERENWFQARKAGDRFVSKAEKEAFQKQLEPFMKQEIDRMELMFKLRCPKAIPSDTASN